MGKGEQNLPHYCSILAFHCGRAATSRLLLHKHRGVVNAANNELHSAAVPLELFFLFFFFSGGNFFLKNIVPCVAYIAYIVGYWSKN